MKPLLSGDARLSGGVGAIPQQMVRGGSIQHRLGVPSAPAAQRELSSNRSRDDHAAFGFLDDSEADLFTTRFAIEDASVLQLVPANSCGYKALKAMICVPLTVGIPMVGWAYGCAKVKLVPQGSLGLVLNSGKPVRARHAPTLPVYCRVT